MADLEHLVDLWWTAIQDLTTLAGQLPPEAWRAPTDLEGWDVHDQVAHVAHLETILAGGTEETVDVGSPEHVKGMMGTYTEQGVVARKGRTPAELIAEIGDATARRKAEFEAATLEAAAPAPGAFGLLGWSTEKLLKNRPLDVWMHAQDIRRAVGRPGGLDSAPAQHVADYLLESVGFVVGKKVGAPVGTTVMVDVVGSAPVTVAVGDDGRARPSEPVATPTVRLTMDREAWIILAGGRRSPDAVEVSVDGDADLAAAILANLAVTP
jgi:uncharacterized protein (TIGR03083 family)